MTVCFQYETARFELYLDRLIDLPVPNIRKLFKYMLTESWNNQTAIDAIEQLLPLQIEKAKAAWVLASAEFQNGWRYVPNKKSRLKEDCQKLRKNKQLTAAVKGAKNRYERWVKIQTLWADANTRV